MSKLALFHTIKEFRSKNRSIKIASNLFAIIVSIVILAPFIANDKPLVCRYNGHWMFPIFSSNYQITLSNQKIINYQMGKEWKLLPMDFAIFPPCAYSPNSIDADNAPRVSPFDSQKITYSNGQTISLPLKYWHWFGTTENGTDVLSGIIHGTKISFSVGIFSMLIAGLLGISLGASAGYFGNTTIRIGLIQSILLFFSVGIAWFYGFVVRASTLSEAFESGGLNLISQSFLSILISSTIIYLFSLLGKRIDYSLNFYKTLYLPIDTVISRIIEILNSIPSLLLIISLSAIAKPSYSLLVCIIGFLSWTDIARLTRAEFFKAKQLDYVTSCKATGMNHPRIMFKHILPNVFPLIIVQLLFGMAGAVLVESSLSFIGVGVPLDVVTWGSLLNEGRDSFSSWWLVLFPGLSIFTLVFIYNKIGSEISKIR